MRSPKLTVVFSQSSYILIPYRVVASASPHKETELQSYLRILKERETRLAVSTRVLLPMVRAPFE
eukprot:COSAG03_NODE_3394_length_2043_cov_13.146680_1_plen_64_part_10